MGFIFDISFKIFFFKYSLITTASFEKILYLKLIYAIIGVDAADTYLVLD